MSEPLTFMMGEFAASIPIDRNYVTNHMWVSSAGSEHAFGFSAYAVRLLQTVYFLDWDLQEGASLTDRQAIGSIESKKAESELYAPMSGTLTAINQDLLRDPSLINSDGYGAAWLFRMQGSDHDFLSPDAYLNHLDTVWEVTQRTIKGQLQ